MVETRPKRTAAARAESENKRIALAAMKPMEAQDLQTQEDYERERPAPHRRASVQPEASPKKTPDRSPLNMRAAADAGRSSQVQVVIPHHSSAQLQRINAPSHSRSQSVPAASNFHQPSPQSSTPASLPRAQNTLATRNLQRSIPPQSSSPGPNSQAQSHNSAVEFEHHAPPKRQRNNPASPAPQPTLLEQVINSNRAVRQQASAQAVNATNFLDLALAHPQPQNAIHAGFQEGSPANRAFTKSAEGTMAFQAPPMDAVAARALRRQMSSQDMMRLGLSRLEPAQKLQQAYSAQRMGMGTAQTAPGQQPQQNLQAQRIGIPHPSPRQQQYAPNQPPRPRTLSFPPGYPAGLAGTFVPGQQNAASNGQVPIHTNRPGTSSETPRGPTPPSPLSRTGSTNSAVSTPYSSQQSAPHNSDIPIHATHTRASSEAPMGTMPPLNRPRAQSAGAAVPNPHNFVISGLRFPPHLTATNNNATRPRIKLNFDRNANPRGQTPEDSNDEHEDSDATLSPSPRKTPGPNRDSDATVSPSPLKNTGPGNGRVLPPIPLFHQEEEPVEAPVRPRAPSHTRVLNQAQSRAHPSESGLGPANRQTRVPSALSDNEPIVRQRNLDFQHKLVRPGADPTRWRRHQEERSAGFDQEMNEANGLENVDPRGALGSVQQQSLPERPPLIDNVEIRFQVCNYALAIKPVRTIEENEELRLSTAFTNMLCNLKLARVADKNKVQEELPAARQSKSFIGCLAVTQLPPAVEAPLLSRSRTFHEIMVEDDDDVCVFCSFETCFGISDSRVWLPLEASPGFCNECHEDTQQVFRLWEDPYRLPHGLSREDKEKYKGLLEMSTATPLKELGDAVDFKAQQKVEMSKPRRQNAILNASKPCTKDGRKDRREQRKEYNLVNSVRNVPRGGKLPQRRAVSGGTTRRNSFAVDVQRAVSDGLRGNPNGQQMGNRNAPHIPSPLSGHAAAFLNSNPRQAVETGWTNGVPSALPMMTGAIATDHSTIRARHDNGGVITPNSAAFMGILDLSTPPGSTINSTTTSTTGTPASSSPTLSNSSIPGRPNTAHSPSSMSAQPTGDTGPSGVPQYFNPGPPGSFLNPPPFNSGPIFCRGSPWRQVDFTKAKICTACRDCKFLICSHMHHMHFTVLAELPGVLNGEHEGLGLGRVTSDGRILADGRYSNCMVCPGQATHGCEDCPLRLCAECVVRLTKLCKGKINELLNFYNNGRDHIRNDAFLLRNDNKGF